MEKDPCRWYTPTWAVFHHHDLESKAMQTQWHSTTKYIVGIGIVIFGIYVINLSSSVIPLLIVAGLLAVIVRPAIDWIHRQLGVRYGWAVTLVYTVLIFMVPTLFVLLIPALINAVNYIIDLDYEAIIQRSIAWGENTLIALKAVQMPSQALDIYIDQTVDMLLTELQNAIPTTTPSPPTMSSIVQSLGAALTTTFGAAANLIGNVFSTVLLIIYIVLAAMYMNLSGRIYFDNLVAAIPDAYRPEITQLLHRLGRTWNSFFRGQLMLMLIIGVITWVGLTILGIPGALSLAIVAGLLEIIPNLGPIVATIPAVIVALLQGSTYLPLDPWAVAIIVLVFYLFVQQLENSFVVPRVLGDAVGLSELVVMTGVLVGATVWGILGALLATPVIASVYELLRYAYAKMNDTEPFPAEPISPPHSPGFINRWLPRRIAKIVSSNEPPLE